jgi:hypothetical protein
MADGGVDGRGVVGNCEEVSKDTSRPANTLTSVALGSPLLHVSENAITLVRIERRDALTVDVLHPVSGPGDRCRGQQENEDRLHVGAAHCNGNEWAQLLKRLGWSVVEERKDERSPFNVEVKRWQRHSLL